MKDATLALAGAFQAVYLVRDIAHTGNARADLFEVAIRSIFETSPPDTESVYGGRQMVQTGLRLVGEQLGGSAPKSDMEITGYIASLMHLERKLVKNAEMMGRLGEGIERTRGQAEHFSMTHPNVIAALADLYVNTVSTLTPRIIVGGQHGHLSNPDNANKVRALLLSAMRSMVLWRHSGGNRLQLLFKRKQVAREAELLMAS